MGRCIVLFLVKIKNKREIFKSFLIFFNNFLHKLYLFRFIGYFYG